MKPGDSNRRRPLQLLPVLVLLLFAGAIGVAAEVVPKGKDGRGRQSAPDARYASQHGTYRGAREADLEWAGDEHLDSANETCEARTVEAWADHLDTVASPQAVAREFARRNYSPSLRRAGYEGCLAGLAAHAE